MKLNILGAEYTVDVKDYEAEEACVEIKLADKYKALELLAKHLGFLAERPEAEERLEDDPLTKSIKEAADGFFKEAVGDIGVSEE